MVNLIRWDRVLSVILVLSMLGGIGALAYAMLLPETGEKFTQFYILGPEGQAEGYPKEIAAGEKGRVLLGIVNHELRQVSYRIESVINGERKGVMGPVVVDNGGRWEQEVVFVLQEVGSRQKVEFLLYKEGEEKPTARLRLFVEVKEKEVSTPFSLA